MHPALDASQIVRLFDNEMRRSPPLEPGQTLERADRLVRSIGRYNMIVFSELAEDDVDRVVAEQAAYFSTIGEDLEWKLYAHDGPPTLRGSLAAHGFEPDETETLLVLDLSTSESNERVPAGVEVLPVTSGEDLAIYLDVTNHAFGRRDTASALEPRLFGPGATTIAFVAFVDGRPAAGGRLALPPERSFASLWGGGTEPTLRRRGAYRALVAERARIARERGYRYLTVDALETSRPILERLGFTAIGSTTPWSRSASRTSSPTA